MSDLPRHDRQDAVIRPRAHALIVIASLLALFLSQPFHAGAPIAAAGDFPAAAGGAVVSKSLPAQALPHDADFCSICRATSQTRLGLRAAARLGVIAAQGPRLHLQLPAPTLAKAAPQLRDAQPRAPPPTPLPLSA